MQITGYWLRRRPYIVSNHSSGWLIAPADFNRYALIDESEDNE
jgi:hypothetical protein